MPKSASHIFTARCTICTARYCYRKSSVRLSVRPPACDVEVPWAYKLGNFENNYNGNQLSVFASQSLNIGNLVQEEHPKIPEYADDTQLYISVAKSELSTKADTMESCIRAIHDWLMHNGLPLNPAKSEVI